RLSAGLYRGLRPAPEAVPPRHRSGAADDRPVPRGGAEMTVLFLQIVNLSISASWLIAAVLVLRLLLKKAPRWISVLLWGLVAIRLVCPFSIESALSLLPSASTIPSDILTDPSPSLETGIPALDRVVNPVIEHSFAPQPAASANPLQILLPVLA